MVLTVPIRRVTRWLLKLSVLLALANSGVVASNEDICDATSDDGENCLKQLPDYLIVGAGGSGLQTALLLQKHGRSYTILEKSDVVGSFWTQFPRFDELISVNKIARNETQHFRYDWHSLLEAPLLMKDISTEYFPTGQDWHMYMTKVAEKAQLNIEYGVHVSSVANDNRPCVVLQDGSERCARHRVFIGTGLKPKEEPLLEAMGGIPYSRIEKQMAVQRKVCILGNGNSGFEAARNLYGVADRVVILGKQPFRLSSVTRYTGDVRVKFLQAVENFHGKLLDTVIHYHGGRVMLNSLRQRLHQFSLTDDQLVSVEELVNVLGYLNQYECELLVLATGFRSVVPGKNLMDRFPPMQPTLYAAADNSHVHYIGWLMHADDFRRGAGGFLSGYRYLIRNLVDHVQQQDFGVDYPHLVMTSKEQVEAHVIYRIQMASDLIILQDGVVVRDVIMPVEDGSYHYYEGITYNFHKDIMNEDAISVYFAWGDGRRSSNVFDSVYWYKNSTNLINLFLHPVIETRGVVRHIIEDLDMAWIHPHLTESIQTVISEALDHDLSKFSPREFFPYVHPEQEDKHGGVKTYEDLPYYLGYPAKLIDAIWIATYFNYENENAMELVTQSAKEWKPALFEANK